MDIDSDDIPGIIAGSVIFVLVIIGIVIWLCVKQWKDQGKKFDNVLRGKEFVKTRTFKIANEDTRE